MTTLAEACRYIRSKNAGPFWITVDLFFTDQESFDRYAASPAISNEAVARVLRVEPAGIRRFVVANLRVVKISYPRSSPQGGVIERDMHGGQQYIDLLAIDLDAEPRPSVHQ